MPPRSSSPEPTDTTVTVEVYAAGPPGSGEGSGVAIGFGPANFDAAGAVIEEQYGLPPHLEPLPYNRDLDGPPWWERRPGDPPPRRLPGAPDGPPAQETPRPAAAHPLHRPG